MNTCHCYSSLTSTLFFGLNSCCIFPCSLPVPTPSVTITITAPSGPLYAGDSLTLQCQVKITISNPQALVVDTPLNYTWKKSGEAVSSAIAGLYSNTLNIMSVTTSTGGSYRCEVFVTPKEFVSSDVGMKTVDVVVTGIVIIETMYIQILLFPYLDLV